ncbi:MAG TPA: PIG-L deacetylase family protein [Candidatus Sulfotelmatobacter sp.]|nr:PIG-L deacetylase family protein [Candidatus Sulfotelmatobacter sp.]
MQTWPLKGAKNILCLGAHSDDIEIGCGGAILTLTRQSDDVAIWWVVFTADGRRRVEAKKSASTFLRDVRKSQIIIRQFRNGYFPFEGAKIKDFFESLKARIQPDLIFTHFRNDRHQDHRVISDLTWNTFRSHLIFEYEIPKYDGDLASPNLFVPLDEPLAAEKADNLCRFFSTQNNKHWFDRETFLALMRLRGMECCSKYAEAFYVRKMVCGF